MARMDKWFACVDHVRVTRSATSSTVGATTTTSATGPGWTRARRWPGSKRHRRPRPVPPPASRARGCLSRAPDPNGTGEDARPDRRGPSGHLHASAHRRARAPATAARAAGGPGRGRHRPFDEWESCLSWLPVTEYGHSTRTSATSSTTPMAAGRRLPDRYSRHRHRHVRVGRPRLQGARRSSAATGRSRRRVRPRARGGNGPAGSAGRPANPTANGSTICRRRLEASRRTSRTCSSRCWSSSSSTSACSPWGVQHRPGYRYRTAAGVGDPSFRPLFRHAGLRLRRWTSWRSLARSPRRSSATRTRRGRTPTSRRSLRRRRPGPP